MRKKRMRRQSPTVLVNRYGLEAVLHMGGLMVPMGGRLAGSTRTGGGRQMGANGRRQMRKRRLIIPQMYNKGCKNG